MPGASGLASSAPPSRRRSDQRLDRLPGHAARAEETGRVAQAGDDGGFDSHIRRPAVEHRIDSPLEVAEHMVRRRRADTAGPVGGGSGHRAADPAEQGVRQRMGGHAQAEAVEAGAGEVGHRAGRCGRHDEGQRARPEGFREPPRGGVEQALGLGGLEARHMGDERVEARALLGLVDARHGFGPRRVGAEAVDGLGREGDEPAVAQEFGRAREPGLVGRQPFCGPTICLG